MCNMMHNDDFRIKELTHWPLVDAVVNLNLYFTNTSQGYVSWALLLVNAAKPHQWLVNFGPGNGFVPSDTEPSPEQISVELIFSQLFDNKLANIQSYLIVRRAGLIWDLFDRNKILSGGDPSHYQVPHCIRVFFYFVWFVFIHHNFQFYFELCTYCNILDNYLS